MKISDFDFDLPKELIAQFPSDKRDEADLLIADFSKEFIKSKIFNLPDYLQKGDLLVFNNSKVIKAKLLLKKDSKPIDIYLNKQIDKNYWTGFAKPAKKLKEGDFFDFGEHKIIIDKKLEMGEVHIKFELKSISLFAFLEKYGEMPLPPYIKRLKSEKIDEERYQTIYSSIEGSIAAPTAGLHFTQNLLDKIKTKGVETTFVTLHVGAGTFLPVKSEYINDHKMHSEICEISKDTANMVNKAKKEGRRIIAIGSTSLRSLEARALNGEITEGEFETNIFIKPGFKFQIIDLLFTNFHLPKSTLLILVAAFVGYNNMRKIYDYAIKEKMRFFSYGDAMLLNRKFFN